jgi:type II secretory pathway pseudopilin PulG
MQNSKCKIKTFQFTSHFFAFTLAEVLITLGIIGIVAALTIPVLMNNSDKQTTVTKVKEAYSIISQATTSINNDCGGDIATCITSATANNANDPTARAELANLYKSKLSLAKDCTDGTTTGCFANQKYKTLANGDNLNLETVSYYANARMILTNGISVEFSWLGSTFSPPYYFWIYIDINGTKAPNQFGKDTFVFYYDINQKCIKPNQNVDDCGVGTNAGSSCSSKIIQEGAINYY